MCSMRHEHNVVKDLCHRIHAEAWANGHLRFGFPANYTATRMPMPTFTNHKEDHITAYSETELLGTFNVSPFTPWAQCSPIMMRPKSMPSKLCIILDLSFPPRRSVNAGIPRREYLNISHYYRLPSVARLERRLVEPTPLPAPL